MELHRPAIVFFIQRLKWNLGEPPKLVLSAFSHVHVVSVVIFMPCRRLMPPPRRRPCSARFLHVRHPQMVVPCLVGRVGPAPCRRREQFAVPPAMGIVPVRTGLTGCYNRSDWWGCPFIHLAKICRLPNKLRKNPKNTRSVLFECLGLNLQGKNIICCEMILLVTIKNLSCV